MRKPESILWPGVLSDKLHIDAYKPCASAGDPAYKWKRHAPAAKNIYIGKFIYVVFYRLIGVAGS